MPSSRCSIGTASMASMSASVRISNVFMDSPEWLLDASALGHLGRARAWGDLFVRACLRCRYGKPQRAEIDAFAERADRRRRSESRMRDLDRVRAAVALETVALEVAEGVRYGTRSLSPGCAHDGCRSGDALRHAVDLGD